MPDILQIKRGLKEHLPQTAREGELLLCTDTKELFVGINGVTESIALESNSFINSDIPVPVTIGGIEKGTTFKEAPLIDVVMQLIYPYTPPLVSFSSNQSNLVEAGTRLTGTTCTAKITKRMYDTLIVKLYKGDRVVQTWNNVTTSFDTPTTLAYSDGAVLTTDTTYKLEVQDEKKMTNTSFTIKFELPTFVGACANIEPSASEINSALKSIKKKGSFSHNFTTNNKRMMLIYPESWGSLANIKDVNQFDITNTFKKQVINHITVAGSNKYIAYVSNLTTVNNFKVNFNF